MILIWGSSETFANTIMYIVVGKGILNLDGLNACQTKCLAKRWNKYIQPACKIAQNYKKFQPHIVNQAIEDDMIIISLDLKQLVSDHIIKFSFILVLYSFLFNVPITNLMRQN